VLRIEQVPAGARAESACVRPLRVWATALLTSAVVLGGIGPASALPQDFWSDEIIVEPAPPPLIHRRHKAPRPKLKEAVPARKPQRPLIVTISINNQSLKVYDANGLFAETPVSTGMRGHSTPLGVFSVIQKNKWHRSNIYSGAPMPYMQRLTWSGIAMHAGVLPGYPASHGCIRMPTHFASQIWHWTRMGARVVVTPGEISPVPVAHPLLMTKKLDPATPVADAARPAQQTAPADTASVTSTGDSKTSDGKIGDGKANNARAEAAVADLAELRPSMLPGSGMTTGLAPSAKPTKVADAATAAQPNASATLIDGAPAGDAAPAAASPPTPKRTGPVSVFISRKDGKLYARQNFEPIFDVPVTIAAADQPLGTHVFTAQADGDAATFRWTALSLPALARPKSVSQKTAKRRHDVGAVETEPATPSATTASEALDRITLPPQIATRLAEALTTGASIIVSDEGLSSETGQGTEFVVPLR